MNTLKILHCADLHIGAKGGFLEEKAPLRRREILLTFEKIVDLAVENSVDLMLISGDLFDSNSVEASLTEPVFEKIKSVPKLRVIYAAGNHDPLNAKSPFKREKLPPNLFVLDTEETVLSFPEIGAKIFGRSFEAAFCEGKASPGIIPENNEFINICVLHGELTADKGSRYNPITKEFMASSGMDYLALGHIHKRQAPQKIGNTYFAYPGTPEGQGFDELGEAGVLIGEVGKEICNLEFIPTAKRQHILLDLDITENCLPISEYIINTLKAQYGENFGENLYKIRLLGEVEEDTKINLSDLEARVSEQVYFVKIKELTAPKIDLSALSQEKSLKGIFVKKMLEKIELAEDKALCENALRLGLKAFSEEIKFNEN